MILHHHSKAVRANTKNSLLNLKYFFSETVIAFSSILYFFPAVFFLQKLIKWLGNHIKKKLFKTGKGLVRSGFNIRTTFRAHENYIKTF